MRLSAAAEGLRTRFDRIDKDYGQKQYAHGLTVGKEYDTVYISRSGAWGAEKYHSSLRAYERLGYHANTAELYQGFLDSGVKIVDHRV